MMFSRPAFSRSFRLKTLLSVFAWAVLLWSSSAFAAATEGKEYRKIAPQTTEAPDGKIEVVMFFSYVCGGCAELSPRLDAWSKKLPDDVVFYKVPVSWDRAQWKTLAYVYYALDALGEEKRLSSDIFDAIHKRPQTNLTDKKIFLDWAEKKGIDRKKLEDMYDSFAINSKVMQASKKAENFRVGSVPRVYINGLYEINTEAAGAQLFSVIDEVIDIARQEVGKK